MTKLVSFLIPTRKRPHGMKLALESILNTASDPSRVEVLFLIDEDDEASQAFAAEYPANDNVQFFVTPRIGNGYEHLYHYYNLLYTESTGEFLFIFNDDTVMVNQGWDDALAKFSGQIVVIDPKWNYEADYATFPIVSRKFPQLMGTFAEHVYIDRWFTYIARAAGPQFFVKAQEGDNLIELNHLGDTDRRTNGNEGEFPQLVRVVDFFTPPEFSQQQINELAARVRG